MRVTGNERFDCIYINSRDRVYKTAYYYTKRNDIAEDIMQDTFMELYMNIDDINKKTEENWLLTVAKNKSLNWQKKLDNDVKKFECFEEKSEELMGQDLEGSFFENERNIHMGNLSKEIFLELKKENERWYEAVTLVYCHGKPQREVADELDMSIEVLHANLYRARNWIKRKYGDRYGAL